VWWTTHAASGSKPVPHSGRLFSDPRRVRRCPHHGTIAAEGLGQGAAIAVQVLPQLPPDAAGLPASAAVVCRIPAATRLRPLPPGPLGAGDREDRFDEAPVTQFQRTTGLVLDGRESRFKLRPGGVSDTSAYMHRPSPPCLAHAVERMPTPSIRQHALVPGVACHQAVPTILVQTARDPVTQHSPHATLIG
jgi:hypothetical protein